MKIDIEQISSALRKKVLEKLELSGYSLDAQGFQRPPYDKDWIRKIHVEQRLLRVQREQKLLSEHGNQLLLEFAEGFEVDPSSIEPVLVRVDPGTHASRLFRFACLLWSVPVSAGFGRRLRYLVRDQSNGRLIGIFALGDPVLNLSVRDSWIGWDVRQKIERLCNVLDAYVVGAVPPYSHLLGGKLVASLTTSREVREEFARRYGSRPGLISGRYKNPTLALITTNSALGRSSLYNRLQICGTTRFQLLGNTRGYGYFHLDGDLFRSICDLLALVGHPYVKRNRFGQGPNWRMRVLRVGLRQLGLAETLLRHGVSREVYAVELGSNSREFLRYGGRFEGFDLPAAKISLYWRQRWALSRAERFSSWREIRRSEIAERLGLTGKQDPRQDALFNDRDAGGGSKDARK